MATGAPPSILAESGRAAKTVGRLLAGRHAMAKHGHQSYQVLGFRVECRAAHAREHRPPVRGMEKP